MSRGDSFNLIYYSLLQHITASAGAVFLLLLQSLSLSGTFQLTGVYSTPPSRNTANVTWSVFRTADASAISGAARSKNFDR